MGNILIPTCLYKKLGKFKFTIATVKVNDHEYLCGNLQLINEEVSASYVLTGAEPESREDISAYLLLEAAKMCGIEIPEVITYQEELQTELTPSDVLTGTESMVCENETAAEPPAVSGSKDPEISITSPMLEDKTDGEKAESKSEGETETKTRTRRSSEEMLVERLVALPEPFDDSILREAAEFTKDYTPPAKRAFDWGFSRCEAVAAEISGSQLEKQLEDMRKGNQTIAFDENGRMEYLQVKYPKDVFGDYFCLTCGEATSDEEAKATYQMGALGPYHIECWKTAKENKLSALQSENSELSIEDLGFTADD